MRQVDGGTNNERVSSLTYFITYRYVPRLLLHSYKNVLAIIVLLNFAPVQALPLGGVIDSIRTTLSETGLADEQVSGLLRQKYLLHFLYKYISR